MINLEIAVFVVIFAFLVQFVELPHEVRRGLSFSLDVQVEYVPNFYLTVLSLDTVDGADCVMEDVA